MSIVIRRPSSLFKSVVPKITEPHVVNFWLSHINPLWSIDQALGRVVGREQLSSALLRLTIRCNTNVDFGQPGQHHPVNIEISGRRYQRHYSLTRLDRQHMQLHLKRVDGGRVSTWLWDHAQLGQMISFGKPYGEVTLGNFKQQRLLWLAAGSGITPMYSLLNQMANAKKLGNFDITLLYWAQRHEEFAFTKQFDAWQQQYPHFKVHYLCTQEAPFDARLNAQHSQLFGDLSQTSVFACGPSGFVTTAHQLCQHASQLQTEAFSLSLQPSSATEQSVAVTLTKSQKQLNIPMGVPILQALEQAGLEPAYGCRMGICNHCVCHKVSGVTHNMNNGDHNAEPAQSLKICINSAQSDLVLDL